MDGAGGARSPAEAIYAHISEISNRMGDRLTRQEERMAQMLTSEQINDRIISNGEKQSEQLRAMVTERLGNFRAVLKSDIDSMPSALENRLEGILDKWAERHLPTLMRNEILSREREIKETAEAEEREKERTRNKWKTRIVTTVNVLIFITSLVLLFTGAMDTEALTKMRLSTG